jgi:endoglycosylceramidase
VIDPNQPPTGANLKQAKLEVLSEPYPQVVAGTPTSYGFDDATRQFRLTYSTRGPTGTNFARRLGGKPSKKAGRARKARLTQIFVGRNHFPSGYRAAVSGGEIASKPGGDVLKVIACQGRRSVSVTVGPPSSGRRSHGDCRVTQPRRKHRRP